MQGVGEVIETAVCIQGGNSHLWAFHPRHPALNTHEFSSLNGANGEKVFEAYPENKTPAAYRIFWYYGPGKDVITIVAITPHP